MSVGHLSALEEEISSLTISPSSQKSRPHPSYYVFHTWLLVPCLKLLGDLGPAIFSFLTFMPTVIPYLPNAFLVSLDVLHGGSKLQEVWS